MDTIATKTSFDLKFTQIAWVVKDIKVAEKFFKDTMGMSNFGKTVELIQPLSGRSMFQDYLDKNPSGGVQHIAYSVPVADFDKVISEVTAKGYPVIATYNTPIAKIVFFDTYKKIGIMTELMGITKEGEEQVQKMKNQTS